MSPARGRVRRQIPRRLRLPGLEYRQTHRRPGMDTNIHNRAVLYDVASEGITTLTSLCLEREDAEQRKAKPDAELIKSMASMRAKLAATRRELPSYDEAALQAFIDRYAPVISDGLKHPPLAAVA